MRSAAVSLVALLLPLVSVHAFAQPVPMLEAPGYTEGDFWEYRVVGHLNELPGADNLSISMRMDGLMRARVSSVQEGNATLTWNGQLLVQGTLTLPGEDGPIEPTVSGNVEVTYVEQREAPYLFPTTIRNTAVFTLTVALGPFPVSGSATLELDVTLPPGPSSPTYPLVEGEQQFMTTSTIASNLTFSILIPEAGGSSSVDEVETSLRIEVTPGEPMSFPFGTFATIRLLTEAVTGLAPGPFVVVLPGSKQVAYHAEEVGNPLAFRFLQNETEVGNATLQSFSYASAVPPPFWQHPAFLAGLLAVPVALLVYRYWRERRKGL